MKRKRHPDRFQPDKYRDGPKKPAKTKQPRSTWDEEDLDGAMDEWIDMRKWSDEEDGGEDADWSDEEE